VEGGINELYRSLFLILTSGFVFRFGSTFNVQRSTFGVRSSEFGGAAWQELRT
jgi:hypothetical protein